MKNELKASWFIQKFKQNILCYFGGHDYDQEHTKCNNCGKLLIKTNKNDEK